MDAKKLVKADLQPFIGGRVTFFQFIPDRKFRGTVRETLIVNDILIVKFSDKEEDPGGTITATNQWKAIEPVDLEVHLEKFEVPELNKTKAVLSCRELSICIHFCAPIPH